MIFVFYIKIFKTAMQQSHHEPQGVKTLFFKENSFQILKLV